MFIIKSMHLITCVPGLFSGGKSSRELIMPVLWIVDAEAATRCYCFCFCFCLVSNSKRVI